MVHAAYYSPMFRHDKFLPSFQGTAHSCSFHEGMSQASMSVKAPFFRFQGGPGEGGLGRLSSFRLWVVWLPFRVYDFFGGSTGKPTSVSGFVLSMLPFG